MTNNLDKTKTPRTDAQQIADDSWDGNVTVEFARQLERELAAALAGAARWNGCCCTFEEDGETQTKWCDVHAALRDRLEAAEKELQKWEQPFDREKFDATKEQASHSDSLAAQGVYIIALEHALKHAERKLEEADNDSNRLA